MKIALVSEADPNNKLSWSGTPYHILQALKTKHHQVDCIVPKREQKLSIFERLQRRITPVNSEPGRFLERYTLQSLKKVANSTRQQLDQLPSKPDIILSIHSDPIAHLNYDASVPIVVLGDAIFPSLVDYYDFLSGLSQRTVKNGIEMARKGLNNATLTILSSQWAVDSVAQHFPELQSSVKLIPFGANMEKEPEIAAIKHQIFQRQLCDQVKLLLVGVGWHRKGIDRAVAVVSELHRRGIKVELNLVGCKCPENVSLPSYVINHGFLKKTDPKDVQVFESLWLSNHFFILPSRAECCAMVLAEASSYGLPCFSTLQGGIPTAVKHGTNGFTYSEDIFINAAADKIQYLSENIDDYQNLCLSSLKYYHERLNWQVFARDLEVQLKELVS